MRAPRRGSVGNGGSAPGAKRAITRFADLAPRSFSAFLLVVVALAAANFDGPLFVAFWWLAALAVNWEWQTMIGAEGSRPRVLVGAVAISLATPLVHVASGSWSALLLGAGSVGVAMQGSGTSRLLAAAGVLYSGALVLAVVVLRSSSPYGLQAILWLFAVVWGTDVMAYFGGRLIGGPKLWPRLSPSKTWSGFLVGILSGALAGLIAAPEPGSLRIDIALGLVAGIAAQGGDLFESALKRRFGVKDSSRLIPGHGGVMDRLDGFTAAAVFAAALGLARVGVEAPAVGLFKW